MLDNIRIVLLHTSHSGNIGSAARAMKTMGLSQLYLVQPNDFPSQRATALAASAADLLEQAVTCHSIEEAIGDCEIVLGSGSELRVLEAPVITPRQASEEIMWQQSNHQTAIVFGRESSGMTNQEMQLCQKHIRIPGNPDYSSLNLAAAVQIMAYELRMAWLQIEFKQEPKTLPALANRYEMESFYEHLQTTMQEVGFYDPAKPSSLMTKLRRIFNAAQLRKKEIDLLRGFLRAVGKKQN